MVKFNLTSADNTLTSVSVPDSWDEVTFKQYVDLVNYDKGTIESRISILLGISEDYINVLPSEDVLMIVPIISFTFNTEELEKSNVVPDDYKDFYIGHESWKKLEEAKQAINALDGKDAVNAAAKIIKIYTDQDIEDKPVTEVLGLVNFFLSSYINFTKDLLN